MELTGGVISVEHAGLPWGLVGVFLLVVGGLWLAWSLIPWKPRESEPVSAGSLVDRGAAWYLGNYEPNSAHVVSWPSTAATPPTTGAA